MSCAGIRLERLCTSTTPTANVNDPNTSEIKITEESDNIRNTNRWYYWWAELVTYSFSLAGMGVIVWILKTYDRRPESAWTMSLSINAALSIAASFSIGCLVSTIGICIFQRKWIYYERRALSLDGIDVLDGNGTWLLFGNLQAMLWLLRRKMGTFIILGLVLTMASHVWEPLMHQSLQYVAQDVAELDAAWIRTSSFFGGAQAFQSGTGVSDLNREYCKYFLLILTLTRQ